jgi:hypothetical protein
VVHEQFFSRFSEAELGLLADMCQRIAPCGSAEASGADASGC